MLSWVEGTLGTELAGTLAEALRSGEVQWATPPQYPSPSPNSTSPCDRLFYSPPLLVLVFLRITGSHMQVLCRLMNTIKPGIVPKFHANTRMAFKQMENIGFAVRTPELIR